MRVKRDGEPATETDGNGFNQAFDRLFGHCNKNIAPDFDGLRRVQRSQLWTIWVQDSIYAT